MNIRFQEEIRQFDERTQTLLLDCLYNNNLNRKKMLLQVERIIRDNVFEGQNSKSDQSKKKVKDTQPSSLNQVQQQQQQQQQQKNENELTPEELLSPVMAAQKYKSQVAKLNKEQEALLLTISVLSNQLQNERKVRNKI